MITDLKTLNGCDELNTWPSKKIMNRYGMRGKMGGIHGLAWYLLEQYFEGNITIKKDVQPKQ